MPVLHILDPNANRIVNFNAYITAFSDGFKTDYDTIQIPGATDALRLYKGVVREITLSFDVPSQTIGEANENLYKLNTLSTCLYGVKSGGTQTVVLQGGFLKILYENILIAQGKNYSSGVEEAGLEVQVLSYSSKFDFDAGFFTNVSLEGGETREELEARLTQARDAGLVTNKEFQVNDTDRIKGAKQNYIFPKLIKVDMTLAVMHTERPGASLKANRVILDKQAKLYPYKVLPSVPDSCAGIPARPPPRGGGGGGGGGGETGRVDTTEQTREAYRKRFGEELPIADSSQRPVDGGTEPAGAAYERARERVDATRSDVLGGR